MYTWGQGGSGQLGLGGGGRSGRGDEPTRVVFSSESGEGGDDEGGEDDFVFAITAGGWHTGALILGDPKKTNKSKAATGTTRDRSVSSPKPINPIHNTGDNAGHANMPGAFPNIAQRTATGGTIPPGTNTAQRGGVRPLPFFRVGFAGRGAMRGGARGRGGTGQAQGHGHGFVEDGERAAGQE